MLPNDILEADQIISWLEWSLVARSPEVVAFLGLGDIDRAKLVWGCMLQESNRSIQACLGGVHMPAGAAANRSGMTASIGTRTPAVTSEK